MGSSSTILPFHDSDLANVPTVNGAPDPPPPEKSDDSIRVCGKCWKEIASDARICPHCKKAVPEL